MNTQCARDTAIQAWSDEMLAPAVCRYSPMTNDASFRRYFRVKRDTGNSVILVDAPPDRETPAAFIKITQRLLRAGVRVPQVYYADPDQGFLLLEDFGDGLYLDYVNQHNADELYRAAIDMLIGIQNADHRGLSVFDADAIREEMSLFTDWLLSRHLQMKPDRDTMKIYNSAFELLIDNILKQPQTFVHRDYHSRNLLVTKYGSSPGVIDYQDAVVGPISYDLASLLKDCYLSWPQTMVRSWIRYFLQQHRDVFRSDLDENTFVRWFDLTAMQRHFKASGIFARLYHRDGKRSYLNDIPRTLTYIMNCVPRYPEFSGLGGCISEVLKLITANRK